MILNANNTAPPDVIEANSLKKETVVIIIPTYNEASVIQNYNPTGIYGGKIKYSL